MKPIPFSIQYWFCSLHIYPQFIHWSMLTKIWKVIFHLKIPHYCLTNAVEALIKLTVCRVSNLEASKKKKLIPHPRELKLCYVGLRQRNTLFFIIIYLNCKWVFTRWQWYYNKTQHTTHITQNNHHTQTKHSTQNYTNNKGHTTHNEYNYNYN
jgi:hypothetical protein